MDKFFGKKYKLVRSENSDRLLAELGVSSMMRKITKTIKTNVQLIETSENHYELNTKMLRNHKLEFTLGEEFLERTQEGQKVKSVVEFKGNTMIHTQFGEIPLIIERRFFDDEMIAITKYGELVSTSWYEACKDK